MHLFDTHQARLIAIQTLVCATIALGLLAWTGCDTVGSSSDTTETEETVESESVSVGFSTTSSSAKALHAAVNATEELLIVEGSNGTLAITDIRLVVSEMKLKVDDDSSGEGSEFETKASQLDLPLDTAQVAVMADAEIPADVYDEFEFEVEDVDPHDEDLTAEEQAHLEALLDTIRVDYPNWPEDASMVVTGSFTSADGGDPVAFTTYVDAEIEIEVEMSPPLEVAADGLSRSITVELDPARWLTQTDGTVLNLAEFDYTLTEDLYELEAEFENGVAEIEVDTDD